MCPPVLIFLSNSTPIIYTELNFLILTHSKDVSVCLWVCGWISCHVQFVPFFDHMCVIQSLSDVAAGPEHYRSGSAPGLPNYQFGPVPQPATLD